MAGWRFAAALLIGLHLPGSAVAGSLEGLMSSLAEVKERRARFVEERVVGVLDQPLVTEGTLAYQAPDRLLRQDLLPESAIYALEGDRLRIVTDGRERTLTLDQEPMLEALIAPFRAVFAGDLGTLKALFDLTYADVGDGWTLILKPKPGTPGARLMASITIAGSAAEIRRIETEEQDGDRSVMRLDPPG